MLLGVELLQLVGWDLSFYEVRPQPSTYSMEENALLTSLAGNAMSAFAVGAALLAQIAGLASAGQVRIDAGPRRREAPAATIGSSSSDSESEGELPP